MGVYLGLLWGDIWTGGGLFSLSLDDLGVKVCLGLLNAGVNCLEYWLRRTMRFAEVGSWLRVKTSWAFAGFLRERGDFDGISGLTWFC